MSSISSSCCASSAVRRREWWKALPARPSAIVAMPSSDHRIAFGSASTMSTRSPAMPVVVAGAVPAPRRGSLRGAAPLGESPRTTTRRTAPPDLRGSPPAMRRASPPSRPRSRVSARHDPPRRRRRGRGWHRRRGRGRDRGARGRRRRHHHGRRDRRRRQVGRGGHRQRRISTFGSGAISTFGSGGNSTGGSGTCRPPAVLTAITNVVKPTIPTESAFLGDRRRVADA